MTTEVTTVPGTGEQLPDRVEDAAFRPITGREEAWRFTPLSRLAGLHDGTFRRAAHGPRHDIDDLPDGVIAEWLERGDPRLAPATPVDRVSATAAVEATEALVLQVACGAVPERPVLVGVRGGGGDGASFGHTIVDVGDGAEATVVLDQTGPAVLADNVELRVGRNARLSLVTVQDFDPGSVHVQHQRATLARDARLLHLSVTLGGDLVRQHTTARFTDRGGDVEALGVYFADAGQHQEHRLFVDHAVPDCRSNVVYRGALQGADAHTVWIGDVLIRAAATGTDTYEVNRNLVLSDGARADSVPNLEIETGEVVGAGHASATGRFDDEQLFYLQSRGIPADIARRLVVRGFFAELLGRVPVVELRDRLTASIEARLSATVP